MPRIGRSKPAGSLAALGFAAGLAAGCRAATESGPPKAWESAPLEPPAAAPPAPSQAAASAPADPAPRVSPARESGPLPREFEAPAGWESLSDLAFERALDGWLPAGEARRASDATLADLRRALEGGDVTAVRAAVMLARTLDPRAGEVLLARLEERVAAPPGQPERDAGDVVAAAAFGGGVSAREAAARLLGLAIGSRPHPSTSVRVECGRSAIALGRDEAIPFLLGILREGTTLSRTRSRDLGAEDLAWAQVRAAEALATRGGTKSRFRPESSVREREEEASRLESLLPSRRKSD